ncbi:Barwin-related endoglucanase [Corchorus olitorius]|uniref:Barwin-related endoglucanase n=1 Tax=Corchorus olitorius TaxID=93759 RepID=A0A1R3J9R0_9ROSI|nr:Barwin-related endoglucanase [Corchorus olitorius]
MKKNFLSLSLILIINIFSPLPSHAISDEQNSTPPPPVPIYKTFPPPPKNRQPAPAPPSMMYRPPPPPPPPKQPAPAPPSMMSPPVIIRPPPPPPPKQPAPAPPSMMSPPVIVRPPPPPPKQPAPAPPSMMSPRTPPVIVRPPPPPPQPTVPPPPQDCKPSGFITCRDQQIYPTYTCSPPVSMNSTTRAQLKYKDFRDGRALSACDGKYHGNSESVVTVSTGWFEGGSRCNKRIQITASNGRSTTAVVVGECDSGRGCDKEHAYKPPCMNNVVQGSDAVWKALRLDKKIGSVNVTWSVA